MNEKFLELNGFFLGGWGWLVCGAAFLAHLLTSGIQLAFGLLYLYTVKFLLKNYHQDDDMYILGVGKSRSLSSRIYSLKVQSICEKKLQNDCVFLFIFNVERNLKNSRKSNIP